MTDKKQTGINCFNAHMVKGDWILDLFEKGENFFNDNTLGPEQIKKFNTFLKDAGLKEVAKNKLTSMATFLFNLPYDAEQVVGVMLVELVHNNSQFKWYINNMDIDRTYTREELMNMLEEAGATGKNPGFVIAALNRLSNETPFGTTLNFTSVEMKGKSVVSAKRNKCTISDPRVLLYALYKYAEENDGYYSFSLRTLMDMTVNSVGISPVRIFGFTRDELEPMLRGLSAQYQDFIDVTFTHDLDKISLMDYHSTGDVVKLLEV